MGKNHDILDKAACKEVGNAGHIIAFLYNSVSIQHCEVWAWQFPCHNIIKDAVPPSEVWSLWIYKLEFSPHSAKSLTWHPVLRFYTRW